MTPSHHPASADNDCQNDHWSLWRMLSVLVSCTDWWLQSVADTWCCTTTPGHTGSSWYNWSVTSSTLWLTVLTSHTLCQHSEEGGLVITLLQSQDTQHCLHHIPLLCHYGNSTLLHLDPTYHRTIYSYCSCVEHMKMTLSQLLQVIMDHCQQCPGITTGHNLEFLLFIQHWSRSQALHQCSHVQHKCFEGIYLA